jgi:hypothetical protein
MVTEIVTMVVGLCASISGIIFAFVGYKRNERKDNINIGKDEGSIVTDIAYIKSSVDRMERNISIVDDRYRSMAERLAKVEEGLANIQKRIE